MIFSRKTPTQRERQSQASSFDGFQEYHYQGQGQEQALTLLSSQALCLC